MPHPTKWSFLLRYFYCLVLVNKNIFSKSFFQRFTLWTGCLWLFNKLPPKLGSLKEHMFMTSQFLWVRQAGLGSHRASVKVSARAGVSSEVSRIHFQASSVVTGWIQFLVGCWTGLIAFFLGFDWTSPSVPCPLGFSIMAAGFLRDSNEESLLAKGMLLSFVT